MPTQKGKRRKRPRTRAYSDGTVQPSVAITAKSGAQATAKSVRRKGWTPPLWINVAMGVGMLLLGTYFTFIVQQKGMSPGLKAALFVGYCIIGGFYLTRAYRQFRSRQETD